MEEERYTVIAGVGSLGGQELGLEAPKLRVIFFCVKWELVRKMRREIRDLSVKSRRRREDEEFYGLESVKTQDCVSAPPLTSRTKQRREAENEEEMEELGVIPSAVSGPCWVCTCAITSVEQQAASSWKLRLL